MDLHNLNNWVLETSASDGVSVLSINKANASVNVISSDVVDEFEQIIDHLTANPPKGLIVNSSKPSGFLAGADVNEFTSLDSKEDVLRMIQRGQDLLLRFERLPFTTVAAIHGPCLGGGAELALACDYRVADESNDCKIGLPEVKLGIHPGYGGVVRLTRLIDDFQALMLMMSGRILNGKAAAKLGFVDIATQKRHLNDVALRIAKGALKPKRKKTLLSKVLAFQPCREIAAKLAISQLKKKANPKHYPAPFQIVNLWCDLPSGDEPAYLAEAESFAELFERPNARRAVANLVRIFLLDKELKGRAKAHKFTGKNVHVVGAGVMGGDIAAWCALRGFNVTLQDAKNEFIAPAIKRAYKLFKKKLKRPEKVQAAMDRLMPDPNADGVPTADLIIEAITERLEAKQSLFASLEPRMKTGAILASNTSSIPLEELSENLQNPERLVGIHFFNPVPMMQLVEVVRGNNTGEDVFNHSMAFVNKLSKLPIEVKSASGFLVNRVLMSYLAEAMRLYDEGVAPEVIDAEAVNFGMPMGPIELSDVVGLDICQAVAKELLEAFGGQEEADDMQVVASRVERGDLGKKTGKGFYVWKKGKPQKEKLGDITFNPEISDRMIYAMLNESMQCLAEGIVTDTESLDMGMIFGTGFPPFHGGPMQYIKKAGQSHCEQRLQELAEKHGSRFLPQSGWRQVTL